MVAASTQRPWAGENMGAELVDATAIPSGIGELMDVRLSIPVRTKTLRISWGDALRFNNPLRALFFQRIMREMLDTDEAGRLLIDQYGLDPRLVRPRTPPEADVQVFRVETRQDRQWLLRVRRSSRRLPSWLGPGNSQDWFGRQAAVLRWCRRHDFPAPALRRTLEKQAVALWEGWVGLLVSFLPGGPLTAGTEDLPQLAQLLARLHTLESPESLPPAWWYPLEMAANRARTLMSAVEDVPEEWLALYAACLKALDEWPHLQELPVCTLHGDCYPGNALALPEGILALIDWEYAGRGPAVLDLGTLLEDCYTGAGVESVPDPGAVRTALVAYQAVRRLSPVEAGALGAAIRFGAAYRGAVRFSFGQESNWSEAILRGLRSEQARITAAGGIGRLVQALVRG